jgi:hypothetical protein
MQCFKNFFIITIISLVFLGCSDSGGGSDSIEGSDSDVVSRPYSAGDTGPCGGIVFYDDTIGFDFDGDSVIQDDEKDLLDGTNDGVISGDSFLEAAPSGWYHSAPDDPSTFFGAEGIDLEITAIVNFPPSSDDLSGSVGNGEADTEVIYLTEISSTAARISHAHIGGGQNDWFLPSLGELYLMYKNKAVITGIADEFYWSSSERDLALGWMLNFLSIQYFYNNKDSSIIKFRPIRAF